MGSDTRIAVQGAVLLVHMGEVGELRDPSVGDFAQVSTPVYTSLCLVHCLTSSLSPSHYLTYCLTRCLTLSV